MTDDRHLLTQYRKDRSESAFGELVRRHIDLVYATALRVAAGDSHLAEDVTQMVFSDLARKAWSIPADVLLPGWLHRHAFYTASKTVRGECRRRAREQESLAMQTPDAGPEPVWDEVAPLLDASLNELSPADRDALVLRFFQKQDFRAVGAALGISEDAAQKRVTRALDKLRGTLNQRGAVLGGAALASFLSAEALSAAPAGLAVGVTASSLAAGSAVGTGLQLTLMKLMAITKTQLAVASVVLAAGLATPLAVEYKSNKSLHAANTRLSQQVDALKDVVGLNETLSADNRRLSNRVAALTTRVAAPADTASTSGHPTDELLQLRSRVSRLQADMKAAANQGSSNSLADIYKNPAMKSLLQSMYGTMVTSQYGPLINRLGLPPEQNAAFKALLEKQLSAGTDASLDLLTTGLSSSEVMEKGKEIAALRKADDEEIHQLLGDEKFAQYTDYEKNMTGETTISEYMKDAGALALNPDQQQALVHAITEEQSNIVSMKYADRIARGDTNLDLSSILSTDVLNEQLKQEEQRTQRYLDRARTILSADQYASFEHYLTNRMQMTSSMMQMSMKLLGGGSKTNN